MRWSPFVSILPIINASNQHERACLHTHGFPSVNGCISSDNFGLPCRRINGCMSVAVRCLSSKLTFRLLGIGLGYPWQSDIRLRPALQTSHWCTNYRLLHLKVSDVDFSWIFFINLHWRLGTFGFVLSTTLLNSEWWIQSYWRSTLTSSNFQPHLQKIAWGSWWSPLGHIPWLWQAPLSYSSSASALSLTGINLWWPFLRLHGSQFWLEVWLQFGELLERKSDPPIIAWLFMWNHTSHLHPS